MRTYQETHSWIKFALNLQNADYKLWLLLGQVQAKCEHVAGVPLLPAIAQNLHSIFLTKGAFATTSIEGNTLTEEEVRQRLEGKLELPPSKQYLGQEIDNIYKAFNLITNRLYDADLENLTVNQLTEFNKLVLEDLPLSDEVIPGEIREHNVTVGRYRGAPPEDLDYLLTQLCNWLNEGFKGLANDLVLGVLKAIIAHLYIAWIHPFADGNGRTARLVEFQLLLSVGIPTTAAHLLSNHYNQTRNEYYRLLDQSHRHETGVIEFIEYALQGFLDNLESQITLIEQQQLHVHWRDYIYDNFKNQNGDTAVRRRRLVLDLTHQEEPIVLNEIRYVSPRIAEAYAGKTDKTVQRDLNALIELNLVLKESNGYKANLDIMRAFIPQKRIQSK